MGRARRQLLARSAHSVAEDGADEPMYLALENGKVLALEKQPRHVVIEVPVFRTRPVRKYVVVDLTADDIPEIN